MGNNGEIVDIDYDTKTSTDSIRICIDDEEMTEDMMQYKKRQSINSKQSYNPYLSAKNPRNTLSLNSAITRISVPSLMIPPGFSPGLSPDDLTPNTIGTITPDPNCMYGRHIDSYLTEQIVEEEEMKEEEEEKEEKEEEEDDEEILGLADEEIKLFDEQSDSKRISGHRISPSSRFISFLKPSNSEPHIITDMTLSQYMENDSVQKKYEIDEKEKREIEFCKKIDLEQFVLVVCATYNVVLQINYQSISRFKRSKYFAAFDEAVDLKQLLEEKKK